MIKFWNKYKGTLAVLGVLTTIGAMRMNNRERYIFHKFMDDNGILEKFLDEHGVLIVKYAEDLPAEKKRLFERARQQYKKYYGESA